MSSTRVYTPLESESDEGVRITDKAAFEEHMATLDSKPVAPLTYTSKVTVDDEYPPTYAEYDHLSGFTSYPSDVERVDSTTVLKLENFGFEYNSKFFIEFWERVSTYATPFSFLHAAANHFPSIADIAQDGWPDYVYRVECADGEVEVTRLEVSYDCEPMGCKLE